MKINFNPSMMLLLSMIFMQLEAFAANISSGPVIKQYGICEVTMNGDDANQPFDTEATITFYPPDGQKKLVGAFYDGKGTWKARCYANKTGPWKWTCRSTDLKLNGSSGSFRVEPSGLKGMLVRHPRNPRLLATENGQWFSCIGDTGYFIFKDKEFKNYVKEDWDLGINMMRCNLFGALRTWEPYFSGDLPKLQNLQDNDDKLRWMFDEFPGLYMQLILYPEAAGDKYYDFKSEAHARLLRQVVGRFAAYPTITWMIMNDCTYKKGGNNDKVVKITADYLIKNLPWPQLLTTGARRGAGAPYEKEPWCTLVHHETLDALDASIADSGAKLGKFIWCGEDRYETYKPPKDSAYFFGRLFWAWLLSNGSACYGGDWDATKPYSTSGLKGLSAVKHINPYFTTRKIDMGDFAPADELGKNLNSADKLDRLQVAVRGKDELLAYHPLASGHAKLSLDLGKMPGSFSLEWFHVRSGEAKAAGKISGGKTVELTSPYDGDVVCRIIK